MFPVSYELSIYISCSRAFVFIAGFPTEAPRASSPRNTNWTCVGRSVMEKDYPPSNSVLPVSTIPPLHHIKGPKQHSQYSDSLRP